MSILSVLNLFTPYSGLWGNQQADVIAITFGLTTCILTSIGLFAIFISINTQHIITKGREVLWGIHKNLNKQKRLGSVLNNDIVDDLNLYFEIIQEDKFIKKTVSVVKAAFIFIWCIWVICIYFIKTGSLGVNLLLTIFIVIAIIITFWFYKLISKLTNVTEISNIPSKKHLLNASLSQQGTYILNTLDLALYTMQVDLRFYQDKKIPPQLLISFPFIYQEIKLEIEVRAYEIYDTGEEVNDIWHGNDAMEVGEPIKIKVDKIDKNTHSFFINDIKLRGLGAIFTLKLKNGDREVKVVYRKRHNQNQELVYQPMSN
ncbi:MULTISPECIES: hypothetical protein [Bacillus]|uniref:hypothetical protein n=1 Tax=Bacillus TaxID=1386 RepID=UPI000BFD3381|nr:MULTISPECIES: hypothetical protein [Bacillus]AXR16909.1 hypothetical protein DOS87_12580 [Bacillus sp. CR71]AXR22604.1 hypothetical protein DPQ26_12345 [Bacillus sp. E25]PGO57939.1 hypothetical protein CN986_03650 [Bacillus thuringiensis]